MELIIIPAGGTGKYQINDTDLHKPFKDTLMSEAHTWYRAMVEVITAREEDASAAEKSVAKLTELKLLSHTGPMKLAN